MRSEMRGFRLGPGILVTAAFIGPGTVTTAVRAGQEFGTSLLWALVLAALSAVILQEMAGRLGAGGRIGLGEAIRTSFRDRLFGPPMTALVLIAILVGNAAYEGGNLAGAALGAEALGLTAERRIIVLMLMILAGLLLVPARYRWLEMAMMVCVAVMSIAFIVALVIAGPAPGAVLSGLSPTLPEGSTLTLLALIGTTIVPYNLFLHAAAAKRRWTGPDAVRDARFDTVVAVTLGGMVSAAVLLVAAASPQAPEPGVAPLIGVLDPALGGVGGWLIASGLLAAGLSSAITAPMAAGYVAAELFAENEESGQRWFRAASLGVLVFGGAAAALGFKPLALILVAQAANGLLLPLAAAILLILMNRRALLGSFANGALSNVLGLLIIAVTLALGLRGIARAFGILP